jgi:hypothetical protein
MIDWNKVREFVHRRTYFCTVAVLEEGNLRLFPIGSLRIKPDGRCTYFEIFARQVASGSEISFLAVDVGIFFWLSSLLRGRFTRPPALRFRGTVGQRREATDEERQGFLRRVGWLIKTKGGQKLWSIPGRVFIREVQLHEAQPLRVGSMTQNLGNWASARAHP